MEPSQHEAESQKLAQMLHSIGYTNHKIEKAKDSIYGNNQKVDEWTERLCTWCQENEQVMIENLIERRYRIVLMWWEDHYQIDSKKLETRRAYLKNDAARLEKMAKEYTRDLAELEKDEREFQELSEKRKKYKQ